MNIQHIEKKLYEFYRGNVAKNILDNKQQWFKIEIYSLYKRKSVIIRNQIQKFDFYTNVTFEGEDWKEVGNKLNYFFAFDLTGGTL